jgi:phosphatidylserine/phosphatidylglycerophosphate/cardiolipin synthase-like enzyme
MSNPIVTLATTLSPAQAVRVASSLEIDGSLIQARTTLRGDSEAEAALDAAFHQLGDEALASVLRGFATAAAHNAIDLRAVWSGPTFDGDGDHTTAALAHLIDDATEDVFASTFSATEGSEFVSALWRAIARGVSTTVLLDSTIQGGQTAAMLQKKLRGATFLTYESTTGQYAAQHSKVVIIDAATAFVTSANFSDAGAHRNLEAGVIVRDADFASRIRLRFRNLAAAGELRKL